MAELQGKTPKEIDAFLAKNPTKRALYEVGLNLVYQGNQEITLLGKPLTLGENTTITKIKGVAEDDSLICEVTRDGQTITQNISRKEVMFLQLISEKETIAGTLPPEVQGVFNSYVDSLQKGTGEINFGDDFVTDVENAQKAYLDRAQKLAEGDPAKQAILELLKNPQMNVDAILDTMNFDPEEKARLKKLVESGGLQMGGLLLLLLIVGGFSAASGVTK